MNKNKELYQTFLDEAECGGFHTVYYSLNHHLNLSGNQAQIFSYLFSFTVNGIDEDGYCFATRERMSKDLNISMSTLDENLRKLLKRKLICKTTSTSRNHTIPMYCVNMDFAYKLYKEQKAAELKKLI